MEEAIKNFAKQFEFEPEIQNPGKLAQYKDFIVCGMGGSALAGDLLGIKVWRDYSLPEISPDSLVIASSYSGNTEETIDAYETALKNNLPVAAITAGGKLLELARGNQIPYVQIPDIGIQPRMATGFMIKALAALTGLRQASKELSKLSGSLNVGKARLEGEILSKKLEKKVPIVYSSNKNFPVAYNWKIKFNETGKIPAFANRFSELNHNEMTGFDLNLWNSRESSHPLPPPFVREGAKGEGIFSFIFLEDEADGPRIIKRMRITKKLYEARGLEVNVLKLEGGNNWHNIFQNLLIADWTAYYLARYYKVDPEQVPMVEEFKGLMK